MREVLAQLLSTKIVFTSLGQLTTLPLVGCRGESPSSFPTPCLGLSATNYLTSTPPACDDVL